jgi:hypothetical protein
LEYEDYSIYARGVVVSKQPGVFWREIALQIQKLFLRRKLIRMLALPGFRPGENRAAIFL